MCAAHMHSCVQVRSIQQDVHESDPDDEDSCSASVVQESVLQTEFQTIGEGDDTAQQPTPVQAPPLPDAESLQLAETECESARPEVRVKAGDRLCVPRDELSRPTIASVMATKHDGPTVIVYDDMMWAAYQTLELEEALREGKVAPATEEEDVPHSQRARVFLCPLNGSPPDCFLFHERTLPAQARAWRWFSRLVPAPQNGTHGQRYSEPRLGKELLCGSSVNLSGRVTRLVPFKRSEPREFLHTGTLFSVLGFVQATLPQQKSYWAVVCSNSKEMKSTHIYVATLFGKAADDIHVTIVDRVEDELNHLEWEARIENAMVRMHLSCSSLLAMD